jgi:DNA repair exonuclease SbcCD ATPase subunit
MDIETLDNPFIKVTWEDIPENFTQEKIKRVRSYFKRKYNSKNVTVLTKVIDRNNSDDLDIDIEQNVMDTAYQKDLMEQFVKVNDINVDIGLLKRMDDKVNSKLADEMSMNTKYKRVFVRNIKFSNFLSFGNDNTLNLSDLGGITVIDSNPPNFGGKSVLAVDLILFLFFNKTTKSSKAVEIFNRYQKDNEVLVQGEVEIDGDNYIIIRKIIRKKKKSGDWTVSTSLEFLQKLDDGSLKSFTGEQRRETETFIKESIGTMNDFLLTVLTTAGNLESLIESKPTERGNVLSRFIGLEVLKEKETVGKKMYSDWSKKLISNVFNIEDLKHEVKGLKEEKKLLGVTINNGEDELTTITTSLKVKGNERDRLTSEKYTDIDPEIENTNPRLVGEQINTLSSELKVSENKLEAYGDNDEPEQVDLKLLRDLIDDKDQLTIKDTRNKTNLKNSKKSLKDLEESEFCPVCKQTLKDVDHSKEIKRLKNDIDLKSKTLSEDSTAKEQLIGKIEVLETKKIVFDEHEKEMLKKERIILEIEQKKLSINKLVLELEKFEENKTKLNKNIELERNILTVKSEIDRLDNTKDGLVRSIESNKSRIKIIDSTVITNNDRIETIKNENDVEKVFRAYLTVYGKNGIIKTIMKSVVPKLNNELLTLLSNVTTFNLEIRVNDKNEVEFWMKDLETEVEKLLSTGSGYEKTMASLAIRTVLTKVSCLPRPNVTVFDEVLGKVSNDNLEEVELFFNRIKEYFENIFLITHNPLVREWSDNIITVTKKNNISSII